MAGGKKGIVGRTFSHRSARVAALGLAVVLVAGVAAGGWLAVRYRSIPRSHVGNLTDATRSEPQNFLVVGSDSRAFVDGAADAQAYGTAAEVGPPHADTILVVRTFPAEHRVAMVSFPRDLWVPIPGTNGSDRINAAVQGGPERLIQTLADDFGISISHFVEVDFRGFKGLVDAIGGVTLYFPAPVRDWDEEHQLSPTGLDIKQTGCVELNGDAALAYVRSRHYEQFVDGAWQPDPAGDLNRIARQQDFIRRTLGQVSARGLLNPKRLDSLLTVAENDVTLDDRLGWKDLRSWQNELRALTPESLQSYSLPTTPGTTPAGAQVLYLDAAAAEPIFDVFRGKSTAPPTLLPGSVRVRVLDASGSSGRVKAAAYRLAAAGFLVDGVGSSGDRLKATTVRYAPGQRAKAELVASRLVGRSVLEPVGSLLGPDVSVVIGADWKGVVEQAPAETTTTEAPAATDLAPPPTEAPTSTEAPPPPAPAAGPTTTAPGPAC